MPSKLRVKYIFRPLVNLIAKGMSKIGTTPNIATLIMFTFSIFAFISLIIFTNLLFFAIFVFSCGLFDGVDGAIARLTKNESSKGAFLDSTMDRLSEYVIFTALLLYCWEQLLWDYIDMKLIIFISFTATIMISYSRARAEPIYPEGDYDIGLMARSERLFYIFITSIVTFFFGFFNEFQFLFMWLVVGTYIFRAVRINKQIQDHKDEL